jgi:hypothetical protein
MAELHPAASHHLPSFITAPGETDTLMVVTAVILALSVLGFGLLFLRLHSLPERMAHGSHRLQFEVVAVLCLLALFTHIHLFWVAALLLALIDVPDFGAWFRRIVRAVERIAGIKHEEDEVPPPPPETVVFVEPAQPAIAELREKEGRPARQKDPAHA